MNDLSNMKIRTKLTVLIIFVSVLLGGIGLTGLIGINNSNDALLSVYNDSLLAINQLNEMRNNQMKIRTELLSARQETDGFEIMAHADKVSGNIFAIENILKSYKARRMSAEEKKLLDDFTKERMNFGRNGVMPTIDLLQAEKFAEADKLRKDVLDPAYAKASDGIDALIKYRVDAAKNEYERALAIGKTIRMVSVASIVVGLLLTILIGFVITRSVSRGVSILADAAKKLSDGDLTARANLMTEDELGEVAQAFNKMAGDFSSIIGAIRNSTDQVTCAAETQSSTAEQISSLANSQMEQATSVAAAIEGLNTMVREVAEKVQSISVAADGASTMADKGHSVVNAAVEGIQAISVTVSESAAMMGSLSSHSDQIGQIVKVIKDIADQTNLLALNAAIEAARAGEQGRGFAVVADEVRKLAERTTSATSEISIMIGAIQSEISSAVSTMERGGEQVEQGVAMAHLADEAIDQITVGVKHVVEMIQQVAHATREESETTSTVAAQIERIAQMARESSETIGQTAQACHGIQSMTHSLQSEVARFRL
ncbi:MAG: methyl-accepting chemotaxis protein [Betaproteobacteria bacterium]|nr:methyl-accepting chemotaxis protein [Betaproteobacteria bacterium]